MVGPKFDQTETRLKKGAHGLDLDDISLFCLRFGRRSRGFNVPVQSGG